jgi:hypothetical protein
VLRGGMSSIGDSGGQPLADADGPVPT